MIIVLDTNAVIRMFGRQSTLGRLVHAISYGEVQVAVPPAIWLEYEEVCAELKSPGHWAKLQKAVRASIGCARDDYPSESRFPFPNDSRRSG